MAAVEGLDRLLADLKKVETLPRKDITASARAGAAVVRKLSRSYAPKDTKALSKGIITKMERSRKPGKAVGDVEPDPKRGDTFIKYAKDGARYYYPASQEYGFRAPGRGGKGGEGNPKVYAGVHFLKRGAEDGKAAAEAAVVKKMLSRIDPLLKGSG